MPFVTGFRIILRAGQQWVANQDSRLGAALAYYTLFSIAPLLLIATFIAGMIFGEDAARGQVAKQLEEVMGKEPAETVQNLVKNASQPRAGALASIMSITVLVIGALTIFLHVRGALCTIWRLEPPHENTVLQFLVDYSLALVMVLCTGVLLLVSLAASMAIPLLRDVLQKNIPGFDYVWQLLEIGVSLLFFTLLFAAIYWILSGRRIALRYVIYGSFVSSVLFTLGKVGISFYLVYTSTASTYGAAGSLVVFLVWVYYSSQVLFFGAELIQARRTRKEWLNPQQPEIMA